MNVSLTKSDGCGKNNDCWALGPGLRYFEGHEPPLVNVKCAKANYHLWRGKAKGNRNRLFIGEIDSGSAFGSTVLIPIRGRSFGLGLAIIFLN